MIDRDKLRHLEAAATPGPWYFDDDGCCYSDGSAGNVPVIEPARGVTVTVGAPDAALIAAARNALLPLLDELDQVEAQLNAEVSLMAILTGRDMVAEATQRADAAEARVKELEAERDRLRTRCDHLESIMETDEKEWSAERDSLRARVEELESEHEHCEDLANAWNRIDILEAALREVGRLACFPPDNEKRVEIERLAHAALNGEGE